MSRVTVETRLPKTETQWIYMVIKVPCTQGYSGHGACSSECLMRDAMFMTTAHVQGWNEYEFSVKHYPLPLPAHGDIWKHMFKAVS